MLAVTQSSGALFWWILLVVLTVATAINAIVWRRCRVKQRVDGYICRASASRHSYSVWGGVALIGLFIGRLVTHTYN